MTNEDAELIALIDNELDEVANGRLLTRLTEMRRCASVTKSCETLERRSPRRSTRSLKERRFLAFELRSRG
jgi:hypothetical protein